MYKIIVKNKEGAEVQRFKASSKVGSVTVGKESGNDIVISDLSVSAQHCAFEFDGKKAVVRNLKSRNGVLVNGERIKTEKASVEETDTVGVGDFNLTLEWEMEDAAELAREKKKNVASGVLLTLFILGVGAALFVYVKPEPKKPVAVGEIEPILEEPKKAAKPDEKQTDSWRGLLTRAKDAYFNDDILKAAKLFQEVLALQEENREAQTFLAQIKNEMVPQIEKSIKNYIEERNIVSCAKAVEELSVLDPDNEWIREANSLLEGFKKFEAVRELYRSHRFEKAQERIQNVVLVDEETLAEWRARINHEVKITERFKKLMDLYRNGPLYKAFREGKKFIGQKTVQKILQSVVREKLQLMRRFFGFKKLEKQDPLKQTAYGVSLLYDLSEKEDPFIYARVKSRLDELTKMCGPGTDFYVLLNEDTMSQLEQAQDYRGINEVKLALGNYKQALNGLRILAFFSKDDRFRKMENETYREIIEYYEQLQEKIRKLEAINEFETAKRISNLLSRYRVSPRKSQIDAQSPDRYEGEGDDVSTIRAVFNQPVKAPEGQEENTDDASGENDSGMKMSVSGKDSSTDASMQEPEDAAGKDDPGKKEKDTPSPAVEAEDLKETEKPEASPAAKNAAEGKKSETVSKKKPAETVRQDDTVQETETTSGSEKPQKEPDLDIQFTPAPQDQA